MANSVTRLVRSLSLGFDFVHLFGIITIEMQRVKERQHYEEVEKLCQQSTIKRKQNAETFGTKVIS